MFGDPSGAVSVRVFGNPYDVPYAGLASALTHALGRATAGREIDFKLIHQLPAPTNGLIVFAFDTAAGTAPDDLCRGAVATAPAREPVVRIVAAYCYGVRPMSLVRARLSRTVAPPAAAFNAAFRDLGRALFGFDRTPNQLPGGP